MDWLRNEHPTNTGNHGRTTNRLANLVLDVPESCLEEPDCWCWQGGVHE